MELNVKTIACLMPLLLVAVALPERADATEIFRCEIDGVVTFSDQSCGDDAQPHVPAHSISVVEPSADLEEIAEQNRAYMERWRERQEAARQARTESPEAAASRQSQPATIRQQPVLDPAFQTTPPPLGQEDQRQPPAEVEDGDSQRQDRFSALSGPFPGTRRTDRER